MNAAAGTVAKDRGQMMGKNYERFGCGQTHLAVPSAQKHLEDTLCRGSKEIMEIIQAWHVLEMRRTSVHAALSAARVKEKYVLGRKE
jgi:hypothetical protein